MDKLTKSEINLKTKKVYKKLGSGFFGKSLKIKYDGVTACAKIGHYDRHFELFENEAYMLSFLDGAGGCPRVLACGADYPCIIMTFCDGNTVEQLEEMEGLSTVSWLRIYLSICRALNEIHSLGLVHCDIKNDNVIVDISKLSEGVVTTHIIDVGLIRPVGHVLDYIREFAGLRVTAAFDVLMLGRMLEGSFERLFKDGGPMAWPKGLYSMTLMMQVDDVRDRVTLWDLEEYLAKTIADMTAADTADCNCDQENAVGDSASTNTGTRVQTENNMSDGSTQTGRYVLDKTTMTDCGKVDRCTQTQTPTMVDACTQTNTTMVNVATQKNDIHVDDLKFNTADKITWFCVKVWQKTSNIVPWLGQNNTTFLEYM